MKELRERARPLLFNGEGKPASILRVPTYHRLSRATVSSAPKDVAQDNENRYHKFAAEGAPGLQLDLALEGAPEELPDLASKGAPGVLPDLASGDACTRMMSEGVPGITSNLCPGTFGVMSDLSSGADLFSGADLLSGVTSNLCPRVTSDLASGVTTNLQTNVSSGVMSDLNMDTPPDHAGLNPPALASNPTSPVTGADTKLLRKQHTFRPYFTCHWSGHQATSKAN